MSDKEQTELAKIVAEMRELGVSEYRKGDVHVVLGNPTPKADEKSEAEIAHIRDEREARLLSRRQRILRGASSYIGPPIGQVK